jgi:hypothetical protein
MRDVLADEQPRELSIVDSFVSQIVVLRASIAFQDLPIALRLNVDFEKRHVQGLKCLRCASPSRPF